MKEPPEEALTLTAERPVSLTVTRLEPGNPVPWTTTVEPGAPAAGLEGGLAGERGARDGQDGERAREHELGNAHVACPWNEMETAELTADCDEPEAGPTTDAWS